MDFESVIEEEVAVLKSKDSVKAVAVVGSYARDPEADHNDLDLYVVVEDNWRKRVTEKIDGVVVERFFNSIEWSEQYLEVENWWYNYRWFKNADVRYDEEDLFQELRQKAEEVKEEKMKLSDEELREISYRIWDMNQDIDSKDVSQKRFMMNQLFDFLLEKHYLLNNEVPVKENYRLEKLQEFDGYMYKLSQDFLLSSSTMEKRETLDKIVEHVSRKLPEIAPEFEKEKEFFD